MIQTTDTMIKPNKSSYKGLPKSTEQSKNGRALEIIQAISLLQTNANRLSLENRTSFVLSHVFWTCFSSSGKKFRSFYYARRFSICINIKEPLN